MSYRLTRAALLACFALNASGAGAQSPLDPDLLNITCGNYMVALRIADAGKDPTPQRQAQALAAQDNLSNAMLWVHGYLAGRAGAGAAPTPLTKAWMAGTVGKVAKVCRDNSPDGAMPLAEAVKKL